MTPNKHKPILWLIAIVAMGAVAVLVLTQTRIGERVKRESARVFDYEYIPNQNIDVDGTEAAQEADSIYKDFRKKFRFHYQGIGMASFADSSRMILLSDLPPHFETDSVAPIFSKFTHKTELRRHPIGYDGYTTDMVILLGNATRENCDRLTERLNKELFFSDYKPVVMTLPAEERRQYFTKNNIDYQITLNEFNTWFLEEGEGFVHLDDTAMVLTVADLFAKQARGVYFSRLPGFVAWAVAKNADIAPQIKDMRQFTLDADLILGALADSGTLVIVGRERQSPLHELPPLQVETILLLASTTEKELSQSLDINDLMAGKMNDGRDWCPTYLSRELENTEFGDLMTITDVLLKDWSERGTVQEGHYRYPAPGYYPFEKPLFRMLGLSELVYNWNTAGAMYAIDRDGYTLYTLGRTGSLPVSYFNSQERSRSIGYRYESQAYHYFATLGNTDLARVVQYTALYQLFIDNDIGYSGNTYPSFPQNKPFLLYKPVVELLDRIKAMTGDEVALWADSLARRTFDSYQKEQVDKQLRENERKTDRAYTNQETEDIYRTVRRDTRARLVGRTHELKQMLGGLTEEQSRQLARYLAYPRGVTLRDREGYNTYLRARKVNQWMREVGKNNLDLLGMDLQEVKDHFAARLSGNAGRYLKTSSLVVTYNDLLTTGGHNLSSRISRVHSMTHYKPSKGNDAPSAYRQPAESAPPQAKPAAASTPPAGKPSSPSAARRLSRPAAPAVRARNAVIPAAPRAKRGL